MSKFFSRLKSKKLERIHLVEDFSSLPKALPAYKNSLQGVVLTGGNADKILQEFVNVEQPHIFLHMPGESYEEFCECLMESVRKDTLHIQDISVDTTCEEFIRSHGPVRFSFRFQHYLFFFEASVLGKLEKDSSAFLIEKPQLIYQERRSHRRYRLWPQYKVLFNDQQVVDISQKGISFFSVHNYNRQSAIDNGILALPAVYSDSEEYCFFAGGEIIVPQAIITNSTKLKTGYRYGGYFGIEWPSEAIKTLNDFLLALRKKQQEQLK